MKLFLSSVEVTDLLADSLLLWEHGANRLRLKATLSLPPETLPPAVGQTWEVRDGVYLRSGIVTDVSVSLLGEERTVSLTGRGLEVLAEKAVHSGLDASGKSATLLVSELCDRLAEDGVLLGSVDAAGGTFDGTYPPEGVAKTLNRLSNATGLFWFLDASRRLSFVRCIATPGVCPSVDLTFTHAGRLEDLRDFSLTENGSEICNRVIAFRGDVIGAAQNNESIARIGVWEKAVESRAVQTAADALEIAGNTLSACPEEQEIRFSTSSDAFRLGQSAAVYAPDFGLDGETFCVGAILRTWSDADCEFTVFARRAQVGSVPAVFYRNHPPA